MALGYESYMTHWIKACKDKDLEGLSSLLADDFVWSNMFTDFEEGRNGTLEWCKETDLCPGFGELLYQNDEVLVATHSIDDTSNEPSNIIFIAKFNSNKIVKTHYHIRAIDK